ncbi:hypothetical protein Syun_013819 [Stephania yunnanensis]|uniref:Uncharacterized protein n=1 Tax=Stephania yunnanensis TaxID=152371 RepID=A0AAP0JIC6_9MAGN
MIVSLMEWFPACNRGHDLESLEYLIRMICVLSRAPLISLIHDGLSTAGIAASYLLLLIGLDILVFDRVQIRSRARARRPYLAIYYEDIEAAPIHLLLTHSTRYSRASPSVRSSSAAPSAAPSSTHYHPPPSSSTATPPSPSSPSAPPTTATTTTATTTTTTTTPTTSSPSTSSSSAGSPSPSTSSPSPSTPPRHLLPLGLLFLWAHTPTPNPNPNSTTSSSLSLVVANPITRWYRVLPPLGSAWSRHGTVLAGAEGEVIVLTEIAALVYWGEGGGRVEEVLDELAVEAEESGGGGGGGWWRCATWGRRGGASGRCTGASGRGCWEGEGGGRWGVLMVGGLKSSFSINAACSTIAILRLDLGTLEWDEVGRMPEEMFRWFQESSKFKVFGGGERVCFSARRVKRLAIWDCSGGGEGGLEVDRRRAGERRWIVQGILV